MNDVADGDAIEIEIVDVEIVYVHDIGLDSGLAAAVENHGLQTRTLHSHAKVTRSQPSTQKQTEYEIDVGIAFEVELVGSWELDLKSAHVRAGVVDADGYVAVDENDYYGRDDAHVMWE